jgi:hypothetical protein
MAVGAGTGNYCSCVQTLRNQTVTSGGIHLRLADILLQTLFGITLANDQLDAQVFKYIYYNFLHVSRNILFILRRSKCINTASGIVTLNKGPSGAQVEREFLS